MTETVITVRSTRAALRQALASIPSVVKQGGAVSDADEWGLTPVV